MTIQIHVINIPSVGHSWINNPNEVVEILTRFQDYQEYDMIEITSLEELDEIVRTPPDNMIIINAHGETIPMHPSWDTNWSQYFKKISENVKTCGWVFVSISGMPFWCYSNNEPNVEVQWAGINAFLESSSNRIHSRLLTGWSNITPYGRNIAALLGVELPETMYIQRLLEFTDRSSIVKSLYNIGSLSGISAIKMGSGFFIHCGLMENLPRTFGELKGLSDDQYKGLICLSFTIGIIRSNNSAEQIFEQYKNVEEALKHNIVIPLLRYKGFKQVRDVHGVDEHGRDIICYMEDYFENRINIGIQLKATQITSNKSKKNNITEIITQINEAFMVPFYDTFSNTELKLHKMYVITSNNITSPAKEVIRGEYQHKKYVHFMEGDHLKEEWMKHYVF